MLMRMRIERVTTKAHSSAKAIATNYELLLCHVVTVEVKASRAPCKAVVTWVCLYEEVGGLIDRRRPFFFACALWGAFGFARRWVFRSQSPLSCFDLINPDDINDPMSVHLGKVGFQRMVRLVLMELLASMRNLLVFLLPLI
ncbi:hypothetical protein Nepgr_008575 [Nepenthes gracilis]|uniref:Uncharacterized protein n=1 Tax=Nepenthes gracilis TaxID=150966 RepID=A0AAD3XJI5_NEPGR|nr:hypothetical protein Nepgr_008575 [Nepenthes gracilis]